MSHTKLSEYVIEGGHPLSGTIAVRGAKNAASKILLATMLSDQPSVITQVPLSGETDIAAELIEQIGGRVDRHEHTWTVCTSRVQANNLPPQTRKNRLPILTLGPLLQRTGQAEIPMVGGDAIGPRPVNFHIDALRAMGATVRLEQDRLRAETRGLRGATIRLPYPSVGATESIALTAVLAEGRTVIENAAVEPEVQDLLQMLQMMGAMIELRPNRRVVIDGVRRLDGAQYRVMPDRIEAASFACLALATQGDLVVEHARQADLFTFLTTIRRLHGRYEIDDQGIRFFAPEPLHGVIVETDTHPGFMTDWQQPLVTVLTQAQGESIMHETVYEDRFGYTNVLNRMGARIEVSDACLGTLPCRFAGHGHQHSARILGPTKLHGTTIAIPDIRAGMAQVIAALTAEGTSRLTGLEHLDRGYEQLDQRLQAVGARLQRTERVY